MGWCALDAYLVGAQIPSGALLAGGVGVGGYLEVYCLRGWEDGGEEEVGGGVSVEQLGREGEEGRCFAGRRCVCRCACHSLGGVPL